MADFVNNAFWYTVWDAKGGDLLASGTAAMCARLRQRQQFCVCRLALAQGRQAARQVHLPAGAHPAQRGGQPAPQTKKARRCWRTDEPKG